MTLRNKIEKKEKEFEQEIETRPTPISRVRDL